MGSEGAVAENTPVWKQAIQLGFSHGGLCLIVVLYLMLGGALFELLEKQNEIEACMESWLEYTVTENETLFSLIDVITKTSFGSTAVRTQMRGVLSTFRDNSLLIDYDGSWCEGYGLDSGPQHEWTFAGGLFFAGTVITTIGYGHISPKTVWGRILCIPYAMVGIPLMLMFLTEIGDALADVFRYMYSKVICCGCFKRKKRRPLVEEQSIGSATDGMRIRQSTGYNQSTVLPNAPVSESVTRFNSNESRIDTMQGRYSRRMVRNAVAPIGVPLVEGTELKQRSMITPHRVRERSQSQQPLVLDTMESEEDDDLDEIRKVSVPLTVAMSIIGLYIFGGAVLFKYWEGWDMTQSSYFCFVTLSTIGFGDVTPGRDFRSLQANAKLIIATIYSVFGMAILAMCFTLMQEEIVEKFTWWGLKLGFIEPEKETVPPEI